jgi:hypothetical protein
MDAGDDADLTCRSALSNSRLDRGLLSSISSLVRVDVERPAVDVA